MEFKKLRTFGLVVSIVGVSLRGISTIAFSLSLVGTMAMSTMQLASSMNMSTNLAKITIVLVPILLLISLIELGGYIYGIIWSTRLTKKPSKFGAFFMIGIGALGIIGWILNALTSPTIPLTLLVTAVTMAPAILIIIVAALSLKKMNTTNQ